MREQVNLAGNAKVLAGNKKFAYIEGYIFLRAMESAVRLNHQALEADLSRLKNLTMRTEPNDFFIDRTKVQNSLIGLLNSHKTLLDFLKRHHEKENKKKARQFAAVCSYYYDNDLNYRIFETLRNYCQHFSVVPLDIFSDFEGNSYVFIDKQELIKDDKLAKKVRKELESPLPMEFSSIVSEWLDVVAVLYGIVLDYFAHLAEPFLNEYLEKLEADLAVTATDPAAFEILKSVQIKVIRNRMYFPAVPSPRFLCMEMLDRLRSKECADRSNEVKKILHTLRSSRNTIRSLERMGVKTELLNLDTLWLKNVNKLLSGADPF